MDRNRIISPREIENFIAEGQLIVIHEGHVLRLDSWLGKHPGGKLAILHMVGRDATDEINVVRWMALHETPAEGTIFPKPCG